jgi:hypothetical protein
MAPNCFHICIYAGAGAGHNIELIFLDENKVSLFYLFQIRSTSTPNQLSRNHFNPHMSSLVNLSPPLPRSGQRWPGCQSRRRRPTLGHGAQFACGERQKQGETPQMPQTTTTPYSRTTIREGRARTQRTKGEAGNL